MELKPPSKATSTFLFWTTLILAVVFVVIFGYAIFEIFKHKSVVYEETKPVEKTPEVKKPPEVEKAPEVKKPPEVPKESPKNVTVSNVPTKRRTDLSTSLSDIPVSQKTFDSLEQKILNLDMGA